MYSLWRGGVLLGHINPELPSDNEGVLFGVLDATAAFLPGQAISQHTMSDWPGMPVVQHVHVHTPRNGSDSHRQSSSVGPRPLSEGMPASVPSDRQLSLRDERHGMVATDMIAIMPMARASAGIQQKCAEAGVTFSGWCVLAPLKGHTRETV